MTAVALQLTKTHNIIYTDTLEATQVGTNADKKMRTSKTTAEYLHVCVQNATRTKKNTHPTTSPTP